MDRSAFARTGKKGRKDISSKRAQNICISPIKEMELLAAAIEGPVSLGQGTPNFDTPKHIKESVKEAMDKGLTDRYALGPGLDELRREISAKLKKKNSIDVEPLTDIAVTVGANEALTASFLSFIDEGDEVLVTSPNYNPHLEQIALSGGKPVFVPLIEEDGWRLDVDAFREAVTPKTKALLICSPLNPTGTVFKEKDLRELADLAVKEKLLTISDETYEYFTFDSHKHFSIGSVPELSEHSINIFSFSKTYSMTGWRCGYLAAEEGIINEILKVHDSFAICTPVASQYAALAALRGPQDCIELFRREYVKRRDLICRRLDESGLFEHQIPEGAYYVLPKIRGENIDCMDFCLKALNEAKVVIIPGNAFGPTAKGHARMSFCGSEENINKAFDRLDEWKRKDS